MTTLEATELLDKLTYQNKDFTYDNSKLNSWYEVLKDYDFEDVMQVAKESMAEDRFQYQPPTVYFLVKNLKKSFEKNKLNSYKVYCPICDRLFDSYDDQVRHFDRCSSVEYIIREYLKWYPNDAQPNKRDLYNMPESEFKIRYLKLLKHIHDNTTNASEKEIISKIIYPQEERTTRNV